MGTSNEKTDKNLRIVEQASRKDRSPNKGSKERKDQITHYPVDPIQEVSELSQSTKLAPA